MALRIYPRENPRIVEVLAPTTTISVQDLTDEIKEWEQEPANLVYPKIVSTSGKEDLGGGVLVGITAELQNAVLAFQQRTQSDSVGTITSANSTGTTLIDNTATFISDGIQAGDSVVNLTDESFTTVLRVDSETQLTTFPLEDGTDNDYDVLDKYKVFNKIQCEVNGGNLVAVDENGNTTSAFLPTSYTHVVRTSSSSATLQEQADIQYGSYQNGVWIDVTSLTTGTAFPTGTPRLPVNNVADAIAIANERGFKRLYILGNITFGATDNINGFEVIGEDVNKTHVTLTTGVSTERTEFEDCEIAGDISGAISVRRCHLESIDNIGSDLYETVFNECFIEAGTYTFNASTTEDVVFTRCVSGVAGASTPVLDINGAACNLQIRDYNGGIKIDNFNQGMAASIDMASGQIKFGTGVTSGTIICRGVGAITEDLSAGATITNQLLNPYTIWEEPISNHTSSGTFGYHVGNKLLTLAKWLGLK